MRKKIRKAIVTKLLHSNLPKQALEVLNETFPKYKIMNLSRIEESKQVPNLSGVFRLNDVFLCGESWIAMQGDSLYYEETANRALFGTQLVRYRISKDEKHAIVRKKQAEKTIEEPCLLLGGDYNYCHWLTRYLSRLSLIESSATIKSLPFIMNKKIKSYQKESLELIGAAQNKRLRISPKETVYCRDLIVPASPRSNALLYARGCHWMREKLSAYFDKKGKRERKLYVSREDAKRRHILNEEEVWKLLESYGFEKVIPGKLSFKEQIETFSSASFVVGAHGAGLTNILFSPIGCTVVELTDVLSEYLVDFKEISFALSQKYIRLSSEKVYRYRQAIFTATYHDFLVDIDKLNDLVCKLLGQ